ncbi:uncharacterized protein JN550_002690 [Neoarthrinium moseri]|uniref:uncharacterized protein n=1 Tax=Neoarthrinium moseri TaxID=1658444 RepID=UPI001FDE5546|nr:uncharacterized protein JN550_002690 [Neoarthrinium moseri]KAI1874111.1 hypothetical protein JN550_002690 [Neoarthrinium moseri]
MILAIAAVFLATCHALTYPDESIAPPLRILQGGYNSSYAVLEFNPFVTPNTLKVLNYFNTSEGNLKAWLNRHPINPNLVIGCNDHAAPNAPGYLTSYSLDPSTGQLTYIDAVNTGGFPVPDYGVAAAHCAFLPSGLVAGVANYYGQSAATFRFDPVTGRFGDEINTGGILDFPGYTPLPGQIGEAGNDNTSQTTSHPHMIVTHPWLNVLYLPDLGEDLIHIYNFDSNGTLTNLGQYHVPLSSGPRHLAISQDGQQMYILFELAAKIRAVSIDQETGLLTQVGEDLPIYDPTTTTFSLNISAAEVHVSADGRFVYASNRNLTSAALIQPGDPSDTLAVWLVSAADGTLTRIQSAVAPGSRQLRSFELSPAGTTGSAGGEDYVVAGGLRTNNTFVFRRDRASGLLELAASCEGTYQPSTYLWL